MADSLPSLAKIGLEQVRRGEVVDAVQLFSQLQVKAGMKKEGFLRSNNGEEYWREIDAACELAVVLLGEADGSTDMERMALRIKEEFSAVEGIDVDVSYEGFLEGRESSPDSVVQERIEFLEDELERSQEEIAELRQELGELRDGQE